MLLKELFITEKDAHRVNVIGQIPVIQMPVANIEKLEQMASKHIGTESAMAKVVNHPTKSGAIVKVATVLDPNQDGQVQITNIALQHSGNPFFPRIYSAKIYTDGDDTHILMVTMEKLLHLNDIQVDSMVPAMLKNIGIEDTSMADAFDSFESRESRLALLQASNNKNFVNAMNILEPYFKTYQQDLHSDNIMVRTSGGIPQLVLLDPFKS